MNTNGKTNPVVQGVVAGAVALVLTWTMSWSFVDSTKVARWVKASDVAAAVVSGDAGRVVAGTLRSSLLQ